MYFHGASRKSFVCIAALILGFSNAHAQTWPQKPVDKHRNISPNFAQYVKVGISNWAKIVKESGAKIDY